MFSRFSEFFTQRIKRGLVRRLNNLKIASMAREVARKEPQPNGVPVVLGANGIEEIVELPLNLNEQHQVAKSVNTVDKLLETLRNNNFFNA